MNWINCALVLLCGLLNANGLQFHGSQTNATLSISSGQLDSDDHQRLLHLETVFDLVIKELTSVNQANQLLQLKQTTLEREVQAVKQWNQTAQMKLQAAETKIAFLEDSLKTVISENKLLKDRVDILNSSSTSSTSSQLHNSFKEQLDSLNSTSTFLLHENVHLKKQVNILNSSLMLIPQNMSTAVDMRRLENILNFEIEQTVRDREQEMMKNMSATIKDLELRDRYLSLSLLDVHSNMTMLKITLSKLKQQQKTHEEQQNMTTQHLSLSLLEVHNNTAGLSSFLSSLEQKQTMMKSEIQTLSNSQQNNITKLNDTIINLRNRIQSNVAFTAGIIGENGKHTYTAGDTVKFPRVIYQVGGGYNPTTGVFTAPKTGLYLIFCTNVAYNHGIFRTKIMINGSITAGVMAYVEASNVHVYQSASNLVVHQLQVGDRVWIQVYYGTHLYSDLPDTTFSVLMINGSD